MSGKYNGLSVRIKEMSQFAEYIPCFAHSLDLPGKYAAEYCPEEARFFPLPKIFTRSFQLSLIDGDSLQTHCQILNLASLYQKECPISYGPLEQKRLRPSIMAIPSTDVLKDISNDTNAKNEHRQQASGLLLAIKKLETGIMVVLRRFRSSSASLQSSDQDLNSACALYESLHGYVGALLPTFAVIEDKAKVLTGCHHRGEDSRRIQKNCKFNYSNESLR